jgi:hypothetical protein
MARAFLYGNSEQYSNENTDLQHHGCGRGSRVAMAYVREHSMKTILVAVVVFATAACTQEDEQPGESADAGSNQSDAGSNQPDAGSNQPDANTVTDCDTWCGVRAPNEESEGWCPVGGFGDGASDCVGACEELAQTAPLEPLQHCIEEDALCFVVMDQCILGAERLANCTSWCDFRATTHANDGFCEPFSESVPNGDCESVCIRSLQDELPSDSVQECVRNNPLCFVDLEGCAAP